MKVYFYGGPLDGGKETLEYEPERGELWAFTIWPRDNIEQYVYDCQGRFVHMLTNVGKAIFKQRRVKK